MASLSSLTCSTLAGNPPPTDRSVEKQPPGSDSSDSQSQYSRVDSNDFSLVSTPGSNRNSPGVQRSTSRASTTANISRIQSQNGYGVSASPYEDHLDQETGGSEKDPYEVGWDGGDSDPECPRSFHKARKWMIVLIVSSASFCVTGASSIYVSTYAQMEAHFHNSRELSTLGLSLFVLGIALGPMVFGPLSEFYGRRPIYLVAWVMYVIWIIPQAVARNLQTILVARFLDGFSGSTFLAVSGGTVGDLFSRDELQAPMAIFSIAPFIGPVMGPIIGGFINYNTSWRWTYYVLLIWGVALLLLIAFLVPETYHPVLIQKKAQRIRQQTGDQRWVAPTEKVQKSVMRAVGHSLLRPFQLLIFEPMCLCLCILTAILLGILYLFFGAFPLVFSTNHDFNLWQSGLTFLGIGVGLILGMATDPLWHRIRDNLIRNLEANTGIEDASEPEFRLPPAIVGALLVPAGLFMFGWTTFRSVHWIVPIIGSTIFGAGVFLVFAGVFTFLVDAYPQYAASALAANAFVRCTFAAAFPLFGYQMYRILGYQWATSLLGFLTVAMMPFPYIFFKQGKKIRANSRYARA